MLVLSAAFAGWLCLAGSVSAAGGMGTLERIRQAHEIRIGYSDHTPPFSYQLPDGRIVGYSIDICNRIAESLKTRLGLQDLSVRYVARTASNRVQLLRDGAMDIECNASTATAERQKSVHFALSHFFVGTRYVALAKNDFHTLADLKGRSVSVLAGSTNVSQIAKVNRSMKLNLSLVVADSLQEAFDMVTTDRVAAFPMDDVLLKTMIAGSTEPSLYDLSTDMVSAPEPYGFMIRRDDQPFEDAVDDALRNLYGSPQIASLYAKWFLEPLPGSGVNLDLPMSDALTTWFAGFR